MSLSNRVGSVEVAAPAKINLGLEILGCRDDGYHEIATILQAIDLVDEVRLHPGDRIRTLHRFPGIPDEENLAIRALLMLRDRFGSHQSAVLELRKAIPAAAGLGGASADAAAALLAARDFWGLEVGDAELAVLARELGSDVPFFLRGGTALASGRGDNLDPLPSPGLSVIVVTPHVAIARKTATLYAALRPSDFSDGSRVAAQADRLRAGLRPDPALLTNSFERPLYALRPELADLVATMRACGAPHVALSGAGPSHFALFPDPAEAGSVATRLQAALEDKALVIATRERSVPVGTSILDR